MPGCQAQPVCPISSVLALQVLCLQKSWGPWLAGCSFLSLSLGTEDAVLKQCGTCSQGWSPCCECARSRAQLAVQLSGVVLTRQVEGFGEFQNAFRGLGLSKVGPLWRSSRMRKLRPGEIEGLSKMTW